MPNKENIMIEQKLDTASDGSLFRELYGKEQKGVNVYYTISYFSLDVQRVRESEFELKPLVQLNERMGNVAEPATKHFLTRDIYTHITYAELDDKKNPEENASEYSPAKEHFNCGRRYI